MNAGCCCRLSLLIAAVDCCCWLLLLIDAAGCCLIAGCGWNTACWMIAGCCWNTAHWMIAGCCWNTACCMIASCCWNAACWPEIPWIIPGYWWYAAKTSLQAKKSLNISRILMIGWWKRVSPRGSRLVDGSKRMNIMVVHWVFRLEWSRVLSFLGESQ